jgi:hypothetical protein
MVAVACVLSTVTPPLSRHLPMPHRRWLPRPTSALLVMVTAARALQTARVMQRLVS